MTSIFIPCNCSLTWGDHWIVTNNGLPFDIQPGLGEYGEPIQVLAKDTLLIKEAQWFVPTVLISFIDNGTPILFRLSYDEMQIQEHAIKNGQYSEIFCHNWHGTSKNPVSIRLTMPRIKPGYNLWAEAKAEIKNISLSFVFEIKLWNDDD